MTNFIVEPQPGIILSDSDENELPLFSFHLVVIVETDPESYMLPPDDIGRLGEFVYGLFTRFDAETDPDLRSKGELKYPRDVDETIFIWLKYEDSNDNYFDSFAEAGFSRVQFRLVDSEDTEQFEYYLKGVYSVHPDWRVALFGAMFEDEVIGTANVVQTIGFSTTVMTRYCLSNKVFLDLDNLPDYDQWALTAGKGVVERFRSWVENWMDEHGGNLPDDDEEDPDQD